jgi:DinB superfamily
LEAVVNGLTDDALDFKPSKGGWTIRQIVHHVADGDDIWKLGIKVAIGSDDAEFSLGWYGALPQETWGERWAYGSRPVEGSISLLKASREHIFQLMEKLPAAWNQAVRLRTADGQIERVPVGFVIQMQSDHLVHHLKRIRELLQEQRGA